jgi:hypothetical protein
LSCTTGANFATSSGSVGIGTASPQTKFQITTAAVASVPAAGTYGGTAIFSNDTTAYGLYIGSINSGDGYIQQQRGDTATTYNLLLQPNGGNVLIGTTTANGNLGANGLNIVSAETCIIVQCTNASGQAMRFFSSTSTQAGYITVSGATATYNSASDYRLKDITGPVIDSGTFIDALKPKVGTWKSDGSKFVGFIAHEFAEVSPTSVQGKKDAVDSDGKPIYQGMQAGTAEVIANLVAELQSLRKRLAALEAK